MKKIIEMGNLFKLYAAMFFFIICRINFDGKIVFSPSVSKEHSPQM